MDNSKYKILNNTKGFSAIIHVNNWNEIKQVITCKKDFYQE